MYSLEEVKERLEPIIEKYRDDLEFLGVFGSVARGENTEESDIDLFYEFDNVDKFCDFIDDIEETFKDTKVDLVPITNALREKNEFIYKYWIKGSVILHETERFSTTVKNEGLLDRYKEILNYS